MRLFFWTRSPDQHDRQVGVLAIRELITVKVPSIAIYRLIKT
jgi:hypothetical protein